MIYNFTRITTVITLLLLANCFTNKAFAQFGNATLSNIDPGENIVDNGSRGGTSFLTPMYYQLIQNQAGIIYIRNSASIVAGNGNKWIEFYTENTDEIIDIALDSDQNLVALLESNIGIFNVTKEGHRFQSLLEEPVDEKLISISIDKSEIYVASRSNIYKVKEKKLSPIASISGSNFMFKGQNSLLRVDPSSGIYNLDGTLLVNFDQLPQISRVESFGNDYVLAGEQPGIFLWNAAKQVQEQINPEIEGVSCITILSEKWIAIGTDSDGLYIVSKFGEVLLHFTEEDGLPSNRINELLEDNEDGIWIATDNGITRLEYLSPVIRVFDANEHGTVISLQGFSDRLYVGSTRGLFVSQPNFKQFDRIEGPEGFIWTIKTLGESLLIGAGEGFYQMMQDYQIEKVNDTRTRVLTIVPKKKMIFAGLDDGIGVYQYENTNIRFVGKISGISDDIRSMAYDEQNDVLIATSLEPKVFRIRQPGLANNIETLDTLNGLTDNVQVFVDDKRIIYGGQEGILSFNESLRQFEYDSSYGPHFINKFDAYRFFKEENGNVWISSNGFVERLFDTSKGYVMDSTSLLDLPQNTYRALYVDNDGGGWMGGDDGLFHMNPLIKKTPPKTFTTVI